MRKITLDGTPFDCPESFEELTYSQYVNMAKAKNSVTGIISGLLKLNPETLVGQKVTVEEFNTIKKTISWFSTIPEFDATTPPDSITLGGKTFKVPKNLDYESFGQRVEAEMILLKNMQETKLDSEILPDLVAIYFEPLFYERPFNEETYKDFIKVVLEASFIEVYKTGAFFLRRSLGLPKNGLNVFRS